MDGTAEPLDASPVDENCCPLTGRFTAIWHRHHVVSRAQGGDDVPENLIWISPEAHDALHRSSPLICHALIRYVRRDVPEVGAYADRKKFTGYVEDRYGV